MRTIAYLTSCIVVFSEDQIFEQRYCYYLHVVTLGVDVMLKASAKEGGDGDRTHHYCKDQELWPALFRQTRFLGRRVGQTG